MFMTQIFDYTFEWSVTDEVSDAYKSCLSTETSNDKPCTQEGVDLLQEYLDNYTHSLQGYPRYSENGEGGYMSTCTMHTFYDEDDMFKLYANNGVTVGDAIAAWWKSIGTTPAAVWYLPCTLRTGQNPQCESSCAASAYSIQLCRLFIEECIVLSQHL